MEHIRYLNPEDDIQEKPQRLIKNLPKYLIFQA